MRFLVSSPAYLSVLAIPLCVGGHSGEGFQEEQTLKPQDMEKSVSEKSNRENKPCLYIKPSVCIHIEKMGDSMLVLFKTKDIMNNRFTELWF